MIVSWVRPVEAGDPFLESFRYLFLRSVTQDPLRVVSRPVLRNLQVIKQLLLRLPDKLRLLNQGSPLGCKPPDATMLAVPHWTAEINLSMLDDGVVPVGKIDGPIRAHLHVDRPERYVL